MNSRFRIRPALMVCSLCVILQPSPRFKRPSLQQNTSVPDGQHDFDFEIGTWKTHLKRLMHPLTGSTTWVEYDGSSVIRSVWHGRANLVELEVDGPSGHLEGLSLRLYNPQSRQWSLNFANSASGMMSQPTVGEFKNGRGEFFDQEPFNGRMILVRNVFVDITPDSYSFEQAYSDDGGKTWETNWVATDTRLKDESKAVYYIGTYDIDNVEEFKRYGPKVAALLPMYGGQVLAIDTSAYVIEGRARKMNAIIRFPSKEAALGLYNDPDYQEAKGIRHRSTSNGTMVLVKEFLVPANRTGNQSR